MKRFLKIFASIALPLTAGFLGSLPEIGEWYAELNKPFLNPPGWIFAPVWTVLYILMGVAAFFVWEKGWKKEVKIALFLFLLQLVLNSSWSLVFFGLKDISLALANILLLWVLILCTMIAFYRVSKASFILLLPYILWVSFAIYLNLTILIINF